MSENVVAVDFQAPCLDIPAMLRKLATDIESGDAEQFRNMMVVAEHGVGPDRDIELFGWGLDATGPYALGLLTAAQFRVVGLK